MSDCDEGEEEPLVPWQKLARPTLLQLAERVLATSVEKGFDRPEWGPPLDEKERVEKIDPPRANYLAKLALVHTEIDEAIEDCWDRAAFGGELADIAIRLLCIAKACHGDHTEILDTPKTTPASLGPWDAPEVVFGDLRKSLRHAAEGWRKDNRAMAAMHIECAIDETFQIAALCRIDLLVEIERKDAINRTRPYRHGKKSTG